MFDCISTRTQFATAIIKIESITWRIILELESVLPTVPFHSPPHCRLEPPKKGHALLLAVTIHTSKASNQAHVNQEAGILNCQLQLSERKPKTQQLRKPNERNWEVGQRVSLGFIKREDTRKLGSKEFRRVGKRIKTNLKKKTFGVRSKRMNDCRGEKKQIFWVFQRSCYRFRCSIDSHVLCLASYRDAQIPSSAMRDRERKEKVAVGREPLYGPITIKLLLLLL